MPNGRMINAAASSLALIIANPAPRSELPKYSGFLVRAYTPDVASAESFLITPAARTRKRAPATATGQPTNIETSDGSAKYKTAAARTKPSGTRSFWAITPPAGARVWHRQARGAYGRLHRPVRQ